MENLRWGLTFGSFALIISVILGIFNDVNPLHIILRAVIFTVAFFGLGAGLRFFINNFFPELLFVDDEPARRGDFEQPGSIIDITLGNTGEYAVPELHKDTDSDQEMGNIEDLVSGSFRPYSKGIDRVKEEVYNYTEESQTDDDGINGVGFTVSQRDVFKSQELPSSVDTMPEKSAFTPSFGDDSEDLGGLPDLDIMARAFSPSFGNEQTLLPPVSGQSQPIEDFASVQYNKGNKPRPLQGDFNPKELAEGIRTILAKDN